MIQELIVVEGKNDANAVWRALGKVDILWTEGYGLTQEKLNYISEVAKRRGVIVFTDPDSVGEQIRERIRRFVPEVKHVYLSKRDARSKNDDDIGVENAQPEEIRRAFEHIQADNKPLKQQGNLQKEIEVFELNDLFEARLTGYPDSAERRLAVGRKLGIGDTNAKQFLQRLNRFGIPRTEFEQAVREVFHGECI
jgi:ribonuclease M5